MLSNLQKEVHVNTKYKIKDSKLKIEITMTNALNNTTNIKNVNIKVYTKATVKHGNFVYALKKYYFKTHTRQLLI